MSTATATAPAAVTDAHITLRGHLRHTGALIRRNLLWIKQDPESMFDALLMPVVFTLLFLYVFGSALHITDASGHPMRYQDYLLPGLIGQQLVFGLIGTGTATANDFASGVVDRFKSLPVHRLAILTAQVVGQVLEQILGLIIVVGIGLLCGWRPTFGVGGFFELVGLVLLGLLAFTWFGVLIGMVFRSSDAVQGVGFSLVFPLSFLAGTFVPIQGMALIPRVIGEWDPIAALVATVRKVCQGTPSSGSWMLEHPEISMVGWCALIIGVCVPLALRRFSRS